MRRRIVGALAAVCSVALVLVAPRPLTAQSPSTLIGVVTDSVTAAPVVGAEVTLVEADRHLVTDAEGRVLFVDVHGPDVTVRIEAVGYRPLSAELSLGEGQEPHRFLLVPAVELEQLEVSAEASRRMADLLSPQGIARMTEREVVEERGQTLGATIEDVQGVSVIQYGPSLAKPVVRGLHSQRIVVSNSGVRQEGQQWGGEHAPEIDVFGVHEVEVLRGPGSVLHGSDALGGVVRVDQAPLPSGSGLGSEVVFNAFSNNRQGAGSAMLEHGSVPLPLLGPAGFRFRVSGRRAGDASTRDYTLRNTGFMELNLGATLGVTRPWGGWELHASRFDTEIGLFTGAHVGNFDDLLRAMEEEPSATDFDYTIGNPRQEVTHDALRLRSHVHLGGVGTLESTYGLQINRRREYDSHGPVALQGRPAFGLDLYTHTLDVLMHHESVGPLRGTFGVSGMRQGNVSKGKAFLIPQYRLYTGALFVREETRFGRLTFTGGIRYDYRWQHVFPFGDVGTVNVDETRTYTGGSGSLGASVLVAEGWSVGGTLGRGWRSPNVNERFSQGVHHGTAQYELGDTALVSERTWNLDMAVRRNGPRLDLEMSGYRNRVSDYIYLEPGEPVQTIRGAYPAFNFRQTDAVIAGLEVSVDARPTERFSVHASGSVTRGTDRKTDGPLYDMPADRLRLSTRLSLGERPWLTAPWVEVGGTLVREQDRVPSSVIYSLPTAGYGLVDLGIGADEVMIGGQPVEISLTVENLFNRSYRDYLSRYKLFANDQGRDAVLRARMPFGATH